MLGLKEDLVMDILDSFRNMCKSAEKFFEKQINRQFVHWMRAAHTARQTLQVRISVICLSYIDSFIFVLLFLVYFSPCLSPKTTANHYLSVFENLSVKR